MLTSLPNGTSLPHQLCTLNLLSNSIIYISVQYTMLRCAIMTVLSLRKIPFYISGHSASIVLKSLILLFVQLISPCCPVLFQARPFDSLNPTSYCYTILRLFILYLITYKIIVMINKINYYNYLTNAYHII